MRVLVTGGTGFIGRALLKALTASGHAARILTRNPQVTTLPPGAAAMRWDPPGGGAAGSGEAVPEAALEGVDALVHLAGANVGDRPWTAARKRAIRDSRVLGTRALVSAAANSRPGPKILVAASAVGWYGNGGDRWLREGDGRGEGFLAETVEAWEREIFRAEAAGLRTVALRNGVVLGRGGALAKLRRPFALGLGAILGSGKQYLSWIHLEDAVGAIMRALENAEMRGVYNCCAPEPATNREFSAALARALRRPLLLRVPEWAVKLGFGEMGRETLLVSQRASADKIEAAGYRFRYPRLEAALAEILGG
jgi:uncharacterized protein (TIGR01777 family)